MRFFCLSCALSLFVCFDAFATENLGFYDALDNVRKNCIGISEKMSDIKTMAGIGTAVSAVGTAVGAGALATGIVKNRYDIVSDNLAQQIKEFKELEANPDSVEVKDIVGLQQQLAQILKEKEAAEKLKNVDASKIDKESYAEFVKKNDLLKETENVKNEVDDASKAMGNARTGLMATATATNLAGAVVSGVNKIDGDFAVQIGACMGAVKSLSAAKIQAKFDGNVSDKDIGLADVIISECDNFNVSDIEKINNHATGATIASSVGAVTGLVGTVTSGVANSDKVRNADDAQKEKNLNTASNVLAGATGAASLVSTVFNAVQIAAVKRVVETAERCEEVLK